MGSWLDDTCVSQAKSLLGWWAQPSGLLFIAERLGVRTWRSPLVVGIVGDCGGGE